MNTIQKIREILQDETLDIADKLIEIEQCLPKEKEVEVGEIFGQKCQIKREGNTITFDGGYGLKYTDNPRLQNSNDLYYTGYGCTWDTDLDGNRYWKRYHPSITKNSENKNLTYGDIVNEEARIKNIVKKCLSELGL